MNRLMEQLRQALRAFEVCSQPPALIGGLAVNAHNVIRATADIDFLVAAVDADRLHEALLALGYQCIYRTENVANYARDDERLDVLYAHRPYSVELLRDAPLRQLAVGPLRVVSAEGLVGFKLQALRNNPARVRDEEDIRELLRMNRDRLDMSQVRRYFALFDREDWLRQLLEELRIEQEPPSL